MSTRSDDDEIIFLYMRQIKYFSHPLQALSVTLFREQSDSVQLYKREYFSFSSLPAQI